MSKQHFNKKLVMTEDDETDFEKTTKRVRDHCHITGKYRGSAHNDCNVIFKLTKKIPVIFHNLRGHDSHFIMQQIEEIAKKHKVQKQIR